MLPTASCKKMTAGNPGRSLMQARPKRLDANPSPPFLEPFQPILHARVVMTHRQTFCDQPEGHLMLSPLTQPAVSPNYTASTEPEKPKPSPYDPPSDLTPGVPNIRTHRLLGVGCRADRAR